jgi:hypothetical protein
MFNLSDSNGSAPEGVIPFINVAPSTEADANLKQERHDRLAELESRMEKIKDFHDLAWRAAANKKSFSKDLLEIHDGELYRMTHATFTEYLRKRWDLSKSYGYELVQFAREVEKSAIADNFTSPGQLKAKKRAAKKKLEETLKPKSPVQRDHALIQKALASLVWHWRQSNASRTFRAGEPRELVDKAQGNTAKEIGKDAFRLFEADTHRVITRRAVGESRWSNRVGVASQ